MPPVNDAFAGMPRLGRYVLVREIARSNDIVWEATDPQMNRRVAIKELALPTSLVGQARRERIERFYREARAAGAMSHPNIVTIHEVDESDGRYFIAMEYLEGRTLRERISMAGGPVPLDEIVTVVSALCDALQYAHGRGVIHRDIKPDNVHLLPDGRVKLTDFGIARITHEDALTMDGQVFGTPSYMSPEQIVGKEIDARSDIFSLGIVLYEMLAGRKPFTGDSVVTITYRILNDELPAIPDLPPALESVLRRATAKEVGERFSSAGELRAALAAAAQSRGASLFRTISSRAPSRSTPIAAPGAGGQATVLASGRTRLSIPSGTGAPVLPAGDAEPPRSALQTVARVLIPILAVAGMILGGAWMLARAYQGYSVQARRNMGWAAYNRAKVLYDAQRYEEAALAFQRLRRNDTDPRVFEEASTALAYCYLGIAGRYETQGNDTLAQRWLSEALRVAPRNPTVRREWNRMVNKRGGTPARLTPDAAPGNAAAPGASAPPAPAPSRPPVPAASASDFQNTNAQKAAEAERLLERGDTLWRTGDQQGAVRLWSQAIQTGPGSRAALVAGERVNGYNLNSRFPGL